MNTNATLPTETAVRFSRAVLRLLSEFPVLCIECRKNGSVLIEKWQVAYEPGACSANPHHSWSVREGEDCHGDLLETFDEPEDAIAGAISLAAPYRFSASMDEAE